MKQISMWTRENVTPLFGLLITIAVLMTWTSESWAYGDYAGCEGCHGGFTESPYTSLSDGSSWPDGLHNTHRNDMLGGDCDTCHAGGFSPVSLESSNGGTGLSAISCVGCHGRDEDDGNATATGTSQRGAGLRQHHVGSATCSGCHDDQTGYTPVGENVLPNYYANPGTGHPAMPIDSCNPSGTENFAGTALGLDNDGDGNYDTADSNCITVAPTYTVGGTVSGLTGTGLQLQNNLADTMSVTADGPFTFTTELAEGSAYAVTVSSQPTGQSCSVSNGSGTIATADVTDVTVTCVTVPTYSVGGTVSGLTGTGLALQNNGADTLPVSADGPFTFATELAEGSAYVVTVSSQPTGHNCTVTNDSGTIATANVTDVTVTCVTFATYSVGGTVSGLTGTGLALRNNGADTLSVTADGPFTFATELAEGSAYAVTVSSQPTGQNCAVTNDSGTIATADVTDVTVTCVTVPTYSVGGTVSGLTGTGLILLNNGTDPLSVTADGPFTFATEIAEGSTYAISVSVYPTGQTCTITNGSGTVGMAEVTDVAVACEDGIPPSLDSDIGIPTMSAWALIVLSMLLGLMAFLNRRRLF